MNYQIKTAARGPRKPVETYQDEKVITTTPSHKYLVHGEARSGLRVFLGETDSLQKAKEWVQWKHHEGLGLVYVVDAETEAVIYQLSKSRVRTEENGDARRHKNRTAPQGTTGVKEPGRIPGESENGGPPGKHGKERQDRKGIIMEARKPQQHWSQQRLFR